MRAFRRVSQGLACGLDDWERELLARLALEVRAILQSDEPTDEDAGGSTVLPLTRSDPGRPGESERDREVLAALDFDLDHVLQPRHDRPRRAIPSSVSCCLRPQRIRSLRWR